MERIVSGVTRLGLGIAQGYLVELGSGLVLVDTGTPGNAPRVLAALAADGRLPRELGTAVLQPSFLLRGGYVLSPNDAVGGKPCEGQDRITIGACSRPVVETGAAVAVTGILRVQILGAWYPPAWGMPGLWAILPGVGFQIGL